MIDSTASCTDARAEFAFHLAAQIDDIKIMHDFNVVEADNGILLDRADNLDIVGKADW